MNNWSAISLCYNQNGNLVYIYCLCNFSTMKDWPNLQLGTVVLCGWYKCAIKSCQKGDAKFDAQRKIKCHTICTYDNHFNRIDWVFFFAIFSKTFVPILISLFLLTTNSMTWRRKLAPCKTCSNNSRLRNTEKEILVVEDVCKEKIML